MSLRINDVAPDFTAETTQGPIHFHEWIGDGWAVLFSHPKDFTPVCTTELGAMAGLEGEFAKRGAKVIGLSVDPVESHSKWSQDIEDVGGHKVNYPLIGDPELKVAKLYDMLAADAGDTCEGRTPATECSGAHGVRDRAGQAHQAAACLPDDDRPQLRRDPARAGLDPADGEAQGGDAGELEAGRRRHHHCRGVERRSRDEVPGLQDGEAVPADDGATAVSFVTARVLLAASNASGSIRAPMAKWLTRWSAKPVFMGSNPIRCSNLLDVSGGPATVPPLRLCDNPQLPTHERWILYRRVPRILGLLSQPGQLSGDASCIVRSGLKICPVYFGNLRGLDRSAGTSRAAAFHARIAV